MLSNAYFLAKFRFDTADNEPAKNLYFFPKMTSILPCEEVGMVPVRGASPARMGRIAQDGLRILTWNVLWAANKSFEISKFKFKIPESSNLRTF